MKGDSIIVEPHHIRAASSIVLIILPILENSNQRLTLSVAGQSGSGKSETATAIAQALQPHGLKCVILQQDDYFVYPPKTNDQARRDDITWVGPQEVRLELMDAHLGAFLDGASKIEKSLVIYAQDMISSEVMEIGGARIAIADGTYTSLLHNVMCRVFIARDYRDSRAHREKRRRDDSELDPFIDRVLEIEHGIISGHLSRADIIVNKDYSVSVVGGRLHP